MGYNPTWEANSYSDGPEIPCFMEPVRSSLWSLAFFLSQMDAE